MKSKSTKILIGLLGLVIVLSFVGCGHMRSMDIKVDRQQGPAFKTHEVMDDCQQMKITRQEPPVRYEVVGWYLAMERNEVFVGRSPDEMLYEIAMKACKDGANLIIQEGDFDTAPVYRGRRTSYRIKAKGVWAPDLVPRTMLDRKN